MVHKGQVRTAVAWLLLMMVLPGIPIDAEEAFLQGTLPAIYEAEAFAASAHGLSGRAKVVLCSACSNGMKVGDLYGGSSLTMDAVWVPVTGYYRVEVDYISGDPRSAYVSVNGERPERIDFPSTGSWQRVDRLTLILPLQEGQNTLTFSDGGWYAPDIDRVVVHSLVDDLKSNGDGEEVPMILGQQVESAEYGEVTVTQYEFGVIVSNRRFSITYHTESGLAEFSWNEGAVIKRVYSRAGEALASKDYASHEFSWHAVNQIADEFGSGIKLSVVNRHPGRPKMIQSYYVYDSLPFFLTEVELVSENAEPLSTNRISPIVLDRGGYVDLGVRGDNRVLVVPFDNDMWSRYQSKSINTRYHGDLYTSSEVTTVFDNQSRRGMVIGSVTHDTWKTGIWWSGENDRLIALDVFGGFTSPTSTHDTIEHGHVTGTRIMSPKVFVGLFADYRDGLESYGRANAAIAPPLAFSEEVVRRVPFGWNSWGALQSDVTYDIIVETSTFFKEHLQDVFHNQGELYINLDSYWDNLTDGQLADLITVIRKNGQRPGIYWGPFVYWGSDMNRVVEGTGGLYTYGDIVLRDREGSILPTVDGAYALDPTHPGTKMRIDHYIDRFKRLGYDYIKLDFLGHAALEGAHYDPNVQTGIQAYNQGMAYVVDRIGGTMFISASIAPLFPSQYAHSRRISCDIDGTLALTEYQLNNLTYGWWQHGTIYPFADPDYMTLEKGETMAVARSRVNAAAISGTVFLNSDDVRNPEARTRMKALLTNPEINALAAKGKVFRPVEGNTESHATDLFVLHEERESYLAVFNYSLDSPVTKVIDLSRVGLDPQRTYRVIDLWTGEQVLASGVLQVALEPGGSTVFRVAEY